MTEEIWILASIACLGASAAHCLSVPWGPQSPRQLNHRATRTQGLDIVFSVPLPLVMMQ